MALALPLGSIGHPSLAVETVLPGGRLSSVIVILCHLGEGSKRATVKIGTSLEQSPTKTMSVLGGDWVILVLETIPSWNLAHVVLLCDWIKTVRNANN